MKQANRPKPTVLHANPKNPRGRPWLTPMQLLVYVEEKTFIKTKTVNVSRARMARIVPTTMVYYFHNCRPNQDTTVKTAVSWCLKNASPKKIAWVGWSMSNAETAPRVCCVRSVSMGTFVSMELVPNVHRTWLPMAALLSFWYRQVPLFSCFCS